eukprot:1307368-Rhodomonas_salina.2
MRNDILSTTSLCPATTDAAMTNPRSRDTPAVSSTPAHCKALTRSLLVSTIKTLCMRDLTKFGSIRTISSKHTGTDCAHTL